MRKGEPELPLPIDSRATRRDDQCVEIDHYSQIVEYRSQLEQREEIALRLLVSQSSGQNVLDLGCGDACFLSNWSQRQKNLKLFGLDLSVNQITKAKTRLPQAQFHRASLSDPLPFQNNFFDHIYCGEVLEHLINPDHFMTEAFRILKPGGTLVMTTPNLFAWYNRIFMLFGISPLFLEYSTKDSSVGYGPLKRFKASEQPVGHLRIFHPEAFKEIQSMYGFKNIRLKSARFEYLPKKVRWIDDLLSRLSPRWGSILISVAQKTQ